MGLSASFDWSASVETAGSAVEAWDSTPRTCFLSSSWLTATVFVGLAFAALGGAGAEALGAEALVALMGFAATLD